MGLHGSQMRGCQLLMGDCLSVAPQDMPVERRCDPIPPLMRGLYTYAPLCRGGPYQLQNFQCFGHYAKLFERASCMSEWGMWTYWAMTTEKSLLCIKRPCDSSEMLNRTVWCVSAKLLSE